MAQFLIVLILLAVLSTPGIILGVFIVRVISSRARKPTKGNKSIKQPHPDNWKSEWKWDEESQAWVHPRSKKPETQASREEPETNASPKPEINIDFAHAYQAQPLFTRNEWQNYKTLRDVAEIKGYVICPKVRLLDIVKPRNGEQKYKTLLYKIQSKHVDFVICDQNMTIKAIIELDDSTHDTEKGKERDAFVDTVLRSVGYKVIHTRYINHDILDLI